MTRSNEPGDRFLHRISADCRSQQASIQYADEARPIPIEIKDISASGAGFIISEPPRLRSPVVFSFNNGDRTVQVRAAIRWTRPINDSLWRIGCRFLGELSSEPSAFDSEPERQTLDIDVTIRRQLCAAEPYPGRILNCSSGGLCLWSSAAVAVGETLLIEREDEHGATQTVVQIQWTRPETDGFSAGGEFLGPCNVERLRHSAPSITKPESAPTAGTSFVVPWQSGVAVASEPVRHGPLTSAWQAVTRRGLSLVTARQSAPPGTWAACLLIYGWAALSVTGYWPPGM